MKRLGMGALLVLAGCSSFDRDWDAWRADPSRPPAAGWAGRWEGIWHSDISGHEGSLRCIITSANSGSEARYYATYTWCFLPLTFEYTVPLVVLREGDAWTSRGSAELGCWIAGGLYEYEGRASGDEYVATYCSDFDRGVFRLKRVK
jgi:hypothetical protein